jgi:malate permease and related proteins
MTALYLLVACIALGVLARRYGNIPAGIAQGLNWWVINVALPALVLDLIPRLSFDPRFWFLVASQWVVFLGAALVFNVAGRMLGWSRARIGALTLVCGLGNTAFMGYPLLEALRGREGMALGAVADQLGCFIILSIGGVIVAVTHAGGALKPREIARRVLLFPAFVALLVGMLVGQLGGWPESVGGILERLGATLSPIALFSVGLRLPLAFGRIEWLPLSLGLGWKLAAAPALVLLLGYAVGISGMVLTVSVLQAAMAPMISAAILADQHHLEPELANRVLGAGILLSLISVPLWNLCFA